MKLTAEQKALISELYLLHYSALIHYAHMTLNDSQMAEEAVNTVFEIACKKIQVVVASPNPGGWLKQTVKYVIRNMNRAAAHTSTSLSLETLNDEQAISSIDISVLELDLMHLLTPDEYRLYQLVFAEQAKLKTAAKELGISLPACKKRVQRLKEKLKTQYFDVLSPS